MAWYAGTLALCCMLVACGLRLDQADLSCPFTYDGDSLLILPLVKATVDRGFGGHWRNERLGAPAIQELHDFPVIDHLHFFAIWLLGFAAPDPGLLYNLYYLLTYPLTALTAMRAFRRLRLSLPAAAAGGLLFAFLPYHHLRGEAHYFLAAYWLVPLSLLSVLAICNGEYPFFNLTNPTRQRGDHVYPSLTRRVGEADNMGNYRIHLMCCKSTATVVLMAATASAGAYYAFFTCAFLAFAGVYGTLMYRKPQALISAAACIAIIVAFGIINHAPTLLYQREHGRNPVTVRFAKEADLYGLKIAHLVLPIDDHNLRPLARLKACYNSPFRTLENENTAASLGLVGTIGLFGLVVAVLFPIRLARPVRPLAGLTLFGVLLATLGGFGSVFNLLAFAHIRAYNRISVFLAFFCILATVWPIDRFLSLRKGKAAFWYPRLVWPLVLLFGFLDQTPHSWFRSKVVKTHEVEASRYRADRRFFSAIESTLPPHAAVFCLPYTQYPESAQHDDYDHVRGYLHTQTMCWSYGAMKGREADAWQVEAAFAEPHEMSQRLIYRGFTGLYIDSRRYAQEDENR